MHLKIIYFLLALIPILISCNSTKVKKVTTNAKTSVSVIDAIDSLIFDLNTNAESCDNGLIYCTRINGRGVTFLSTNRRWNMQGGVHFENDAIHDLMFWGVKKGTIVHLYDHGVDSRRTSLDYGTILIKKDIPETGLSISGFWGAYDGEFFKWTPRIRTRKALSGRISRIRLNKSL